MSGFNKLRILLLAFARRFLFHCITFNMGPRNQYYSLVSSDSIVIYYEYKMERENIRNTQIALYGYLQVILQTQITTFLQGNCLHDLFINLNIYSICVFTPMDILNLTYQ